MVSEDVWQTIKTIGIIPRSRGQIKKTFTGIHRICIEQEGVFNDCIESLSIIINISEKELLQYSRIHSIPEVIFCQIVSRNGDVFIKGQLIIPIISDRIYYKAKKKHRKSAKFLYKEFIQLPISECVVGNNLYMPGINFNCRIDISEFERLGNAIMNNLQSFGIDDRDHILDLVINGIGLTPWYYSKKLYKGLL